MDLVTLTTDQQQAYDLITQRLGYAGASTPAAQFSELHARTVDTQI